MKKISTTTEDIKEMVWNALDLYGSYTDELKDYCKEEMLDYNGKQVQEMIFSAVVSYGKEQ